MRVLVVDDSVVVRRLVADALSAAPDLEVTTVPSGELALTRLAIATPDAVVLDVEMPGLDGIETLRRIRALHRDLPVIMFSKHTSRGAEASIDALLQGASDCVAKPVGMGSREAASVYVREALGGRLRALCRRGAASGGAPGGRRAPTIDAVGIAVSTGGPNALLTLVGALPADLRAPLLIVQHMPVGFTRPLAEALDRASPLRVREARGGERPAPGEVYLAQAGRHLSVVAGPDGPRLALGDAPPENSCRPAADVLLRAMAEVYGARTLALVLTGMGQDGLRGCEAVRAAGGRILAQDEATSVVWGMPGFVTRAGLADDVLPLERLAGALEAEVARGRSPCPAPCPAPTVGGAP